MKLEEFKKYLKSVKKSSKDTGTISNNIKLNRDPQYTSYRLSEKQTCPCCSCTKEKTLFVEFYRPKRLTIVEAGMLFSIFCLNKKPSDFHESKADMEFIENIKKVEVEINDKFKMGDEK